MPSYTTSFEKLKTLIPSFLEIDKSSYTTLYKPTRFYDKDYDEWFYAIPRNIIKHQSGGKKRRAATRKKATPRVFYTDQEILNFIDVHNIKSKLQLLKKNSSYYHFIKREGKFDFFFKEKYSAKIYSDQQLKEIADTYASISRLKQERPDVYTAIKRRKLTKTLYAHMFSFAISKGENICAYIFDEILGITSERNNRSILSRRKELDIYYPSLKLAIEYDGYYHTTKKGIANNINKDLECISKNITLWRIVEEAKYYRDLNVLVEQIKAQIINLIPEISKFTNRNISADYIKNIIIPIQQMYRGDYTINEIKGIISKYTYLYEFKNDYDTLYANLVKHGLKHLTDSLIRKMQPKSKLYDLTDSEILEYIKSTYRSYNELTASEDYKCCLSRNLLTKIKQFLPYYNRTQILFGNLLTMSDEELLLYFKSNYANYSEVRADKKTLTFIRRHKDKQFRNFLKKEMGLKNLQEKIGMNGHI